MNKELRPLKDAIHQMRMELDTIKHNIVTMQVQLNEMAIQPESKCTTFMADGSTTTATKCRFCGKEQWDH